MPPAAPDTAGTLSRPQRSPDSQCPALCAVRCAQARSGPVLPGSAGQGLGSVVLLPAGMRILVTLLLDTLPMLGNVLLLCFFVFFIFGIVGVQLWAGLLRNRCFLDSAFVRCGLLHTRPALPRSPARGSSTPRPGPAHRLSPDLQPPWVTGFGVGKGPQQVMCFLSSPSGWLGRVQGQRSDLRGPGVSDSGRTHPPSPQKQQPELPAALLPDGGGRGAPLHLLLPP